ncbi:MAG: NAD(P)-dependent oxidoreductase [Thermoguttaceae bacterium]
MAKILIPGGAGYVGGYMTDLLSQNGEDVAVYDNLIYESRFLKNVRFIYGDIRDREKLRKILPQFEVVIWLAAIVGDGACAVDPFLTQSINEDTVKWLVDNYSGMIIFPSTCSVYGINNELIDESAPPNPLSMYAITKLAAEQHIIANHKDYLIFRLGTLYGMGDEHSRIRLDLVTNVLTQKAAFGEPLTVFGGDQWRPLMHVRDVAEATLFGLRKKVTGLFNLSAENYRIREIAEKIRKSIPNTTVVYQDMKFEDQRNYRVTSEAYRNLGWSPKHTMDEGIREMCMVIKEQRIKNLSDPIYYNAHYLNERHSRL